MTLIVLSSCDTKTDAETIEAYVKRDDSKPGYVGVLRAVEVTQHATTFAQDVGSDCAAPWRPTFDGTYRGSLTLIVSRNESERRRFESTFELRKAGDDRQLATTSNTKDELKLQNQRARLWTLKQGEVSIKESVGFGAIAGPRETSPDEIQNIEDAALSGWRLIRAFERPEATPCRVDETDWAALKHSIRGVETLREEEEEGRLEMTRVVTLENRYELKLIYHHTLTATVEPFEHPEFSKDAVRNLRAEGDVLSILKKEGLIAEETP